MGKTYSEQEIMEKLSQMRKQFRNELKNLKKPDDVTVMILKAKIITIGQVMDELGLQEEN